MTEAHPVSPSDEGETRLDWDEYKAGLDKRLDACRAVEIWSGILLAVAALLEKDKAPMLVLAAVLLALGFLSALYLQLATGWHCSVLARPGHYKKTDDALGWVVSYFVEPHFREAKGNLADRRTAVANRLDALAASWGLAVYGFAISGTLLILFWVIE